MVSEKQIDTVARMLDPYAFTLEKTMLLMKGEMFGHHGERVRAARGKAEELLTAAEQAGPAQGVKVKALEWVDLGDGRSFRALLPIIGSVRVEPYGCCGWWEVLWSMPGQCDKLIPDVFDNPDEAKAAAQSDYERRILAALEPAPPVEPVCGKSQQTETRPTPSEARLREALEMIARIDLSHLSECRDIARAALKEASE